MPFLSISIVVLSPENRTNFFYLTYDIPEIALDAHKDM